jgi:ComF family protein
MFWHDLIDVIYPKTCCSCGVSLHRHEQVLCISCIHTLPKSHWHHQIENPLVKLFWGRLPVFSAAAYYLFRKGGNVQRLLHNLKYKNMPEIGERVGELYANELLESAHFVSVNQIIPVPLHPKKLKLRGYNQAECFANGLAVPLGAEVLNNHLLRIENTDTQTKKSRYARWENVSEVFTLHEPEKLQNSHILLVDDVITTGSTIEACARVLLDNGVNKISIAAIAMPA